LDPLGEPSDRLKVAEGHVGTSRRGYFLVIALVSTAMSAFPGILYFALVSIIVPFSPGYAAEQFLFQILQYSSFLISPGLFFVILYLYGKKMERYFIQSYLSVILLIFLGSIVGDVIYFSSIIGSSGQFGYLTNLFGLSALVGAVTEGVKNVFAGFTALGLSYLRTRNPIPPPPQSPIS
jgi:hypothetical protein